MFVLRLTDAPLYKIRRLSSAKIVQGECKDASLLAIIAEPQPIFCKDSANREQNVKLACTLCRGAAYLLQR